MQLYATHKSAECLIISNMPQSARKAGTLAVLYKGTFLELMTRYTAI